MKNTVLSLLSCIGILCAANAQAPRVYDTTTSTTISYLSGKESAVMVFQAEPEELRLVYITMKPLKKSKVMERRTKRKNKVIAKADVHSAGQNGVMF